MLKYKNKTIDTVKNTNIPNEKKKVIKSQFL